MDSQEEYKKAYDAFQAVYKPIKARNSLRMRTKYSIHEPTSIEFYKDIDADTTIFLFRVEDEDDTAAFKTAAERIKSWETTQRREENNVNDG
ncbi:MAG: hypothetical protein E7273_12395 [Pseudobutyrivibrio ruminis]|nr:hypothetical protein [Pseudobutyrivibrio ruminis]